MKESVFMELLQMSRSGVQKWKREDRTIIQFINQFEEGDIEDFLKNGDIKKLKKLALTETIIQEIEGLAGRAAQENLLLYRYLVEYQYACQEENEKIKLGLAGFVEFVCQNNFASEEGYPSDGKKAQIIDRACKTFNDLEFKLLMLGGNI